MRHREARRPEVHIIPAKSLDEVCGHGSVIAVHQKLKKKRQAKKSVFAAMGGGYGGRKRGDTSHIKVVRIGPDPYGRGEVTVFYRDISVANAVEFNRDGSPAGEIFYLWLSKWPKDWPEPKAPPEE